MQRKDGAQSISMSRSTRKTTMIAIRITRRRFIQTLWMGQRCYGVSLGQFHGSQHRRCVSESKQRGNEVLHLCRVSSRSIQNQGQLSQRCRRVTTVQRKLNISISKFYVADDKITCFPLSNQKSTKVLKDIDKIKHKEKTKVLKDMDRIKQIRSKDWWKMNQNKYLNPFFRIRFLSIQ